MVSQASLKMLLRLMLRGYIEVDEVEDADAKKIKDESSIQLHHRLIRDRYLI